MNAKQTLVTSGDFSQPHCCQAVFPCMVSHLEHRRSRQWISGAGSERLSRGELPAGTEAPGSLLGLRARLPAVGAGNRSSFSVKGRHFNHTNSQMMKTRLRRLKARRACRYSLSPPAGVIPNIPNSDLLPRGGSTKERRHDGQIRVMIITTLN